MSDASQEPREIPQGFGAPPLPKYVWVKGHDDGCLWHFWDHDNNKRIPISEKALYGKITGLRLARSEFKDEPGLKLDIQISSGAGTFVVRSGVGTYFTRGFVLSAMEMDNFDEIMCVSVNVGNDPQVVFCRLFYADGGAPVKYQWDKEVDIEPLIAELQKRLGVPVQDPDDVLAGKKDEHETPEFSGPEAPKEEKKKKTPPPAGRKMADEYYASDADDVIDVKTLGKLRVEAEAASIDEHELAMDVYGCAATDLSKKGGADLLTRIQNLGKDKAK